MKDEEQFWCNRNGHDKNLFPDHMGKIGFDKRLNRKGEG